MNNQKTNHLITPKPSEPLLKKDFLPTPVTKTNDILGSSPSTSQNNSPGALTNKSSKNVINQIASRNLQLSTQNLANPINAKPLSAKIMQGVSSDEIDGMIERIKADIEPLLEKCQDQDARINTLKESLHPHILSTRTAVSHLSHLASRAKKTSDLIDQQSNAFIQLAQEDIHRQIESDSVGREKDFSDTQSDLLGGDQLELARSKLLEANRKLEKHIARQRYYERKLAKHLSIIRRMILILLTIKIIIDLRIATQVIRFMNELVPAEFMPAFFARHLIHNLHPPHHSPDSTAEVHPNNPFAHEHQHYPKKQIYDFVAYFLWIVLIKLEFF
ncbi:hypothetical protein PGTUg99_027869 [Puccinia graminis f. sp. tritici]|uniref:Uncharacterized protein n=1 Tax=Puccinia graminis f. sp. tritici TaxID=56615 RepID=A0A5B0S6F2_PUCGR|nr:hypothetical protein PGTUg99_027869 [Puccinia graminis f. sp. tritici]